MCLVKLLQPPDSFSVVCVSNLGNCFRHKIIRPMISDTLLKICRLSIIYVALLHTCVWSNYLTKEVAEIILINPFNQVLVWHAEPSMSGEAAWQPWCLACHWTAVWQPVMNGLISAALDTSQHGAVGLDPPTDLAGLTDRARGPTFPTLRRIIYWGLYVISPHRHRATTHPARIPQGNSGRGAN